MPPRERPSRAQVLEEDDEFEEFADDDWNESAEDDDGKLWQDDWDDDDASQAGVTRALRTFRGGRYLRRA